MKPTLLFTTLTMVFALPSTFAKSELETLRSLCSEQERQIHQLEAENTKLRSANEPHATSAQTMRISTTTKPAAAPTPSESASVYTVIAGDCMEKIARKVGTNPEKLAKANGLKTSSIIRPGQKLKVPDKVTASAPQPVATPAPIAAAAPPANTAKTHKLVQGETFSSIAKKYRLTVDALVAANPTLKATSLRPGQIISLGGDKPAAAPAIAATPAKASTPVAKVPSPAPAVKTPAEAKPLPVAVAAPANSAPEARPATTATKPAVATTEKLVPTADNKFRPVTIEGEMTYGEFATQHGTDAERLNALNGLDLTNATVLAKGSELYVPAQP